MTAKLYDDQTARQNLADYHDELANDAEAEARLLDRRLQRDVNVSNEERARLVCDCFCDFAEALDVPRPFTTFCERFPALAGAL